MVSEGSNYNSELSCGLVETNSKYSLGLAWAGHKFYSIHILLSGFFNFIFHCRVRRIKTSVHVDQDCEEYEGSVGKSRLRIRIGTEGDLNIIKLVVVGERDVRNTSLLKTYTTDHFSDYFLNKDGYGYTAPVKIAKEAPFEQLVWGMENIKVGVVGDRGVGKTCLYITNSINRFPSADFCRIAKPGWD